jgi:hypothetical protein
MAKKSTKTQDETTPATGEIRAPKAKRESRKATATPEAAPVVAIDDKQAKALAKAAEAEARKAKAEADKATREERRTGAHAEIARLVAAESARRLCLCGCGATTPRAFFVPGHDSKLMSRLLDGE